jgi:kynurenine formamidase
MIIRVSSIMKNKNIIDLSHTINGSIPSWPSKNSSEKFSAKTISTYSNHDFFSRILSIPEHFGTHMDAPAHGVKGKTTIDKISLKKLLSPAIVIDVQKKVKLNADYLLTKDDILVWEKRYGKIPNGSVVLMCTGWGKYWSDKKKYLNQDKDGTMHFPGFSVESVEFLNDKRKINGIGVETLSIDAGNSKDFSAHRVVFKHNKFALENLANLDKLPAKGATIIIAPLKIEHGSGSPVRVFAVYNK